MKNSSYPLGVFFAFSVVNEFLFFFLPIFHLRIPPSIIFLSWFNVKNYNFFHHPQCKNKNWPENLWGSCVYEARSNFVLESVFLSNFDQVKKCIKYNKYTCNHEVLKRSSGRVNSHAAFLWSHPGITGRKIRITNV